MSKDVKVKVSLDDQFSSKLKSGIGSVLGPMAALTAAAGGIAVAMGAVGFSMASSMENIEQQFTPLLGGAEQAKQRLDELSKFAANTPFQLTQVAKASKTLETLTKGTLSTGEGLVMVGDAAAVAGVGFDELAVHVGRAYSNLNSNRAAGESISRMQELGLVSGETRNKIESLQKAGKGTEAWKLLQDELKKTSGAMEGLSSTFTGRLSTLKDNVSLTLADVVKKFGLFDVAKDSMLGLTNAVADFAQNVDFSAVGDDIVGFLTTANQKVIELVPNIAGAMTAFQTLGRILFNVGQIVVGSVINTLNDAGTVIGTVVEAMAAIASGEFSYAADVIAKGFNDVADSQAASAVSIIGNVGDIADAVGSFGDNYQKNMDLAYAGTNLLTKGIDKLGAAIDKNKDKKVPGTAGTGITPQEQAAAKARAKESIKNEKELIAAIEEARIAHDETLLAQDEIELSRLEAKYTTLLDKASGFSELEADLEQARITAIDDLQAQQAERRIKAKEDEEKKLSEIAKRQTEEDKRESEKRIAQAETERDQRYGAMATLFGGFAKLTALAAGKDKKARMLSRGLAIIEAGINLKLAAVKALASAPPPFNYALMTGVLAAGGAQIIEMRNQKFAYGGIVQGTETSGDRIPIRVNAREAVLTTGDQKELLDIARGKSSSSSQPSINYAPSLVVTGDKEAPNVRRLLMENLEQFKSFVHTTMKYDSNVPRFT